MHSVVFVESQASWCCSNDVTSYLDEDLHDLHNMSLEVVADFWVSYEIQEWSNRESIAQGNQEYGLIFLRMGMRICTGTGMGMRIGMGIVLYCTVELTTFSPTISSKEHSELLKNLWPEGVFDIFKNNKTRFLFEIIVGEIVAKSSYELYWRFDFIFIIWVLCKVEGGRLGLHGLSDQGQQYVYIYIYIWWKIYIYIYI